MARIDGFRDERDSVSSRTDALQDRRDATQAQIAVAEAEEAVRKARSLLARLKAAWRGEQRRRGNVWRRRPEFTCGLVATALCERSGAQHPEAEQR